MTTEASPAGCATWLVQKVVRDLECDSKYMGQQNAAEVPQLCYFIRYRSLQFFMLGLVEQMKPQDTLLLTEPIWWKASTLHKASSRHHYCWVLFHISIWERVSRKWKRGFHSKRTNLISLLPAVNKSESCYRCEWWHLMHVSAPWRAVKCRCVQIKFLPWRKAFSVVLRLAFNEEMLSTPDETAVPAASRPQPLFFTSSLQLPAFVTAKQHGAGRVLNQPG